MRKKAKAPESVLRKTRILKWIAAIVAAVSILTYPLLMVIVDATAPETVYTGSLVKEETPFQAHGEHSRLLA